MLSSLRFSKSNMETPYYSTAPTSPPRAKAPRGFYSRRNREQRRPLRLGTEPLVQRGQARLAMAASRVERKGHIAEEAAEDEVLRRRPKEGAKLRSYVVNHEDGVPAARTVRTSAASASLASPTNVSSLRKRSIVRCCRDRITLRCGCAVGGAAADAKQPEA